MSEAYADEEYEGEEEEQSSIERLAEILDAENVCDLLDDGKCSTIGAQVVREFELDKTSRSDWEENHLEALKLAQQVAEKKNYPWPNAANVKYPLLTTAAIQFAARAYPAIVGGPDVVKAKVNGKDEGGQKKARGERVAAHMSWQLLDQMPEWEEDTDKLLHILPIAGMAYRKTYRDPLLGRNRSELVTPDKLVINDSAKDIETVPRITQICEFYPYEVEEKVRSGAWREIDLELRSEDTEHPHEFLEQHRLLDLDDDGYAEPYIVTVHKAQQKCVRIEANFEPEDVIPNAQGQVARIERRQFFTKYGLIPNPNGGFHDIGFGMLLRPINEAINTVINQMLDAGHLATVGGGFIGAGARLRGGTLRFRPGEWKTADTGGSTLRENMVPLPVREPSAVLFSLLGLLIDAGKDIAAVTDVMTGEGQGRNASPTTTLALIEQGMQVFSAIYKRVFRSLRAEYSKMYHLNRLWVEEDEYFTVLDEQQAVSKDDYAEGDFDIYPVADPTVVTNMQKLGRAEFLFQFKDDPYFNPLKLRERLLEAASIDDVDDVLLPEPPPNPMAMLEADKMDIQKRELMLRESEININAMEALARIGKLKADAIKALAEAEAAEAGPQIELYRQQLSDLQHQEKMTMEAKRDEGRVSGMAGQSDDGAVSQISSGQA